MEELMRRLSVLEAKIILLEMKQVRGTDIAPHVVAQRHIKDGYIIFVGNIVDRPSDGGTEKLFYYALDEKKLYIWNSTNSAWESATFA